MLIDSVIIKLERRGIDTKPSFNITIYGQGKFVYEGIDNVKTKGRVDGSIKDDKVVALLYDLKNSDFFSFEEELLDKKEGYSSISVSLPENDKIRTKKVGFYNDNAPENFKKLAENIEKTVRCKQWVDGSSGFRSISKSDKKSFSPLKNNLFLYIKGRPFPFLLIIVCIVVAILILGAIGLGIIPMFSDSSKENNTGLGDNGDDSDSNVEYDPPIISSMTTASEIVNKEPVVETIFKKGDNVIVYYVFSNITHNGIYNITEEINVTSSSDDVFYHSLDEYTNDAGSDEFFDHVEFLTDESWPASIYTVTFSLEDKISGKANSSEISFYLNEKLLSIDVLTSASEVNFYQDYTEKEYFDFNENISVYCEYSGVNITDNNECNLLLELNVTLDGKDMKSFSDRKTVVGNNSHAWFFKPNESWSKDSLYKITLYIYDYNGGYSAEESYYFWLGS